MCVSLISSSFFFSASIFGIGAIFGGFLSGYLGSQFGRRKTLILFTIPDIVGWIMIASSQNLTMMLLGRFLCGLAAAGYTPAILVIDYLELMA
jgi:predicted MFS family arabinose efflux permease